MNNTLETYVKNLRLSTLNDKLSDLLNKDAMTGVRNRAAYESCKLICNTFSHSIVFRIGGDEFVSVLWGSDYENRDRLLGEL